jgi:hypothetical protein
MQNIVKVLNLPEEYIVRARTVFNMSEGIKILLREFVKESAKNQSDTRKLWTDVQDAAKKEGIERKEDEIYIFDHITEKFLLVKVTEDGGG